MLSFGAQKKDLPDITDLINKGYSYQQIIDELKKRGYDDNTIKEVLIKNAAALKFNQSQTTIPTTIEEEAPKPQQTKIDIQEIQAILEQIIEEKWKNAYKDIDALQDKIKTMQASIDSLTFNLTQTNKRIDDIQSIVISKNEEFNKTMKDVNIELQALDKVIMELIPTLSSTIREMRDLVEQLKNATNKS